jgi:hypothetical protein
MIVVALLLAAIAAFFTVRALWRARRSGEPGTLFAMLAAALVVGLAVLAATGKLNWIAAAIAAVIPFLRRLIGLLQYLPLLRRLFGNSGKPDDPTGGAPPQAPGMTRDRAIEILGLGPEPTREEVIDAHRRLMQKLHPDRGGSTYLAQQLNEARKALLDERA